MKNFLAITALLVGAALPQLAAAQASPDRSTTPSVEPYSQPSSPSDTQTQPSTTSPTYQSDVGQPLPQYTPEYSYHQGKAKPAHLRTPGGMSILAGGGVGGFTDSKINDVTKTGGTYNLRVDYGTRSPVAIEAAYVGSTQALDALGVDKNALLMSNGVEGSLRYNVLTGMWQPFVTAGAAWKRYNVRSDVNTSNVKENDNVVEIPVTAGLAWRQSGFVLEGRGGFRPSLDNDLLGNAKLHNWLANLNLGVEF